MKKTILINIYYSFGGGGIESMISNLSCEARLQNVESHLLVIGEDLGRVNLDDYDSVNLIDGNLKSRRLAKKIEKKCLKLSDGNLEKTKILIHSPGLWAIFFKLKNTELVIHSIPTLIQTKKGLIETVRKILMSLVYRSHKLVAVSQGVAENLLENYSLRSSNLRVVYNGINCQKLENLSKSKSKSKNALNLPASNFIVCVARLNPVKQLEHLLHAIAMLDDKPEIIFLGGGNQNYLDSLQRLTTELLLTDKVHFMLHVDNPYPYIKNAKLLVLCSKTEALPMVLIESLMLGTPVVSYKSPTGPIEILSEKNPESLVELNNILELSKVIKQVIIEPTSIDKDFYRNKYNITKTLQNFLDHNFD